MLLSNAVNALSYSSLLYKAVFPWSISPVGLCSSAVRLHTSNASISSPKWLCWDYRSLLCTSNYLDVNLHWSPLSWQAGLSSFCWITRHCSWMHFRWSFWRGWPRCFFIIWCSSSRIQAISSVNRTRLNNFPCIFSLDSSIFASRNYAISWYWRVQTQLGFFITLSAKFQPWVRWFPS